MSKLQFPSFDFAVAAESQVRQLQAEIRQLELDQQSLSADPSLPPLEAARDLVKREDKINRALRERRLALQVSDTDTAPHWRKAITDMRSEVGKIEDELRSLVESATAAATRMLSPIVTHSGHVADYCAAVIASKCLLAEFSRVFFQAINAPSPEIAARTTALHSAILEIPGQRRAIEADIQKLDAIAAEIKRRFSSAPT